MHILVHTYLGMFTSLHITLEIGWVSFFALWLGFGLSSDIFFFIFQSNVSKKSTYLLQAIQVLEKIAFR